VDAGNSHDWRRGEAGIVANHPQHYADDNDTLVMPAINDLKALS
jgi:hypothetical protein